MTNKTLFRWINRYADAVSELSWVGSIYEKEERNQVRNFWKAEKAKARQHIKKALDELVS